MTMNYNSFQEYKTDDSLPPLPEWAKDVVVVNNNPTLADLKMAIANEMMLFTFLVEPSPVDFATFGALLDHITEEFMQTNNLFPSSFLVLTFVPIGYPIDKAADIYVRRHISEMIPPFEPIQLAPVVKFGRFMRKPGR